MKTEMTKASKILRSIVAVGLVLGSGYSANAQMDRGNGGDPDVGKFRKIGSEIQSWIQGGYANKIILPAGVTLKKYVTAMDSAFNAYHVSFVDQSVSVRGLQRMCKNTNDRVNGPQIVCQRSLILRELNANNDGIYQLIHHEVAGIAGLEKNIGQESDTRLSDQISKKVVVNRLPVEMGKAPFVAYANAEGSVNSCVGRALNRFLRNEYSLGWDVKIASYANTAQRACSYSRKCTIENGNRGLTIITRSVSSEQLAHQLSSSEVIRGSKRVYSDYFPDFNTDCVVSESTAPVVFNVLVKVNGEALYDSQVTLASLDRVTEFMSDKDTFYCSLKNVKLISKKTGKIVLQK
jgi:hypothetical protein